MSAFKKATLQHARLRLMLYGRPGSGKTLTALMLAEGLAKHEKKRIALIDTEAGSGYYAVSHPNREIHPEGIDFDVLETRSLIEVLEAVQALDAKKYGVLIIDSVSHLWEAAIASYEGKMTKADSIPLSAWSRIKRPWKQMMKLAMEGDFHVVLCARQKNVWGPSESGELVCLGVGAKAEGDAEHEPTMCCRMEVQRPPKGGGNATYLLFAEKDRTSVLAGRMFANPTFETFKPVLALLTGDQTVYPDPDEVAAQDAELLDRAEDEKEQKKLARSQKVVDKIIADLNVCARMPDDTSDEDRAKDQVLASIKEFANTKRGQLIPRHKDELRDRFAQFDRRSA